MTDDATLSDFDSGEATDDDPDEQRSDSSRAEVETAGRAVDDSDTDGKPVDGETTDDSVRETREADADSKTARSTYAWGTYTCSRCDAETERVWRDEDDFVCPACKPW